MTAAAPATLRDGRRSGPFARLRRDRVAKACAALLVGAGLVAALAPALPLDRPDLPRIERRYRPPMLLDPWRRGWTAPAPSDLGPVAGALTGLRAAVFGDRYLGPVLGTDELGRCVLSRLVYGARTSFAAAACAALVTMVLGVAVGAIAGWKGGLVDTAAMRVVDVVDALPLVFVVALAQAFLRGMRGPGSPPGSGTLVFFAALGCVTWLTTARLVRERALSLREREFVDAARAVGLGPTRILATHVLPNLASTVIAAVTLTLPRIVLFESFLSFLGLGVEAPEVSLGVLARSGADAATVVETRAWLLLAPGCALAVLLYALNFLGDAVRDAFDPKGARA